MLCEIIGNYSVYCGDEYVGHVDAANDNTLGIVSSDIDKYDLENIFDHESLLEHIRYGSPMFSVLNEYGLFRFVARDKYDNIYDCLYEYKGFA